MSPTLLVVVLCAGQACSYMLIFAPLWMLFANTPRGCFLADDELVFLCLTAV